MSIPEPTADQCSNKERISLSDGRVGWACWYPQMGGYVGKALAVKDDGCIDMYVWHDGDFPFSGEDNYRDDTSPRKLHHCDGSQFIAFGQFLTWLEA